MNGEVKQNKTVSPYLLYFVMHTTQTGIGVLGFQVPMVNAAGTDSWLSLLITGGAFHIVIFMMFVLLRLAGDKDLVSINEWLFGKWAGKCLSLLFYGYSLLVIASQTRAYAEIISVWAFPNSRMYETVFIVLLVCAYIVTGGFRVVAGVAFFSVILPSILLVTLYYPLQYAHWDNMLPVLSHSLSEYTTASKQAIFSFLGVEFLLVYYPFIKKGTGLQKWGHLAVAHTTLLYLVIMLVSFVFFNENTLKLTIWPTLMFSRIINMTVLERFDYIYVFTWYFVILSLCCVTLWSGVRVLKRTTALPSRYGVWLSVALVYVVVCLFLSPANGMMLNRIVEFVGSAIVFGYVPLMLLMVGAKRLIGKRRLNAGAGAA